nr:MAG TPA: hypothetical protein [Caudoviricetes sp.]
MKPIKLSTSIQNALKQAFSWSLRKSEKSYHRWQPFCVRYFINEKYLWGLDGNFIA